MNSPCDIPIIKRQNISKILANIRKHEKFRETRNSTKQVAVSPSFDRFAKQKNEKCVSSSFAKLDAF